MKHENNKKENWELYLSRPFNLFTTSLWYLWYSSPKTKNIVGATVPSALFIERPKGLVNYYMVHSEIEAFRSCIKNILKNDLAYSLEILKNGEEINKKAEKLISEQKLGMSLEEAVNFLIDTAIYSTIFPYFFPLFAKELNIDNQDLLNRAEALRIVSFYPKIMSEIVIPIARKRLSDTGADENDLEFLTINEILANDYSNIVTRRNASSTGQCFSYEASLQTKTVLFRKPNDPDPIIGNSIEETVKTIKGTTAYGGKVQGKIKLVFSFDGKGIEINENEILVAAHTSPNLLPLMKKVLAIITDEGGITSHAAIVARELKKPCIIGTKIATQVLKDGDLVEVDANEGIIRIIK